MWRACTVRSFQSVFLHTALEQRCCRRWPRPLRRLESLSTAEVPGSRQSDECSRASALEKGEERLRDRPARRGTIVCFDTLFRVSSVGMRAQDRYPPCMYKSWDERIMRRGRHTQRPERVYAEAARGLPLRSLVVEVIRRAPAGQCTMGARALAAARTGKARFLPGHSFFQHPAGPQSRNSRPRA